MNTQRYKKKNSFLSISAGLLLVFLAISILFGILFDLIINKAEEGAYPRRYALYVSEYAESFGVPEAVIYAVIKTESDFDQNAVSSAPAFGLMQLTEETFEWVSGKLKESPSAFDIYEPSTNIRYGVWYLSYLYGKFGSWDVAFAAYNAGPGNVQDWLEDSEYSSDGETLDYIPFKETRNYVEKVNRAIKIYEELYYTE